MTFKTKQKIVFLDFFLILNTFSQNTTHHLLTEFTGIYLL